MEAYFRHGIEYNKKNAIVTSHNSDFSEFRILNHAILTYFSVYTS